MDFADYSKRDFEVVDYQFYQFSQLSNIGFRGPPLSVADLDGGNYFTTIGAAQTLGVYVPEPYPVLLSRRLGLPALNLALGGVNAGFYADTPFLIEQANRGRFVVLQVMTARTERNTRMVPHGISLVRDLKRGDVEIPEVVWQRVLDEEPESAAIYVAENLRSWHDAYKRLFAQLTVPVILFYFSYKPDDEAVDFSARTLESFYGHFPQFVDIKDVRQIAARCDGYAECRSDRNMGHELVSRFTGKPVAVNFADVHPSAGSITLHNHYYPSAEMHEDAVAPLERAVRALSLTQS